jgi:DNA-binding transcriptional MerR regulator
MPKTVRIAKTAIDDAISSLRELPAKIPTDYSLDEAIVRLLPAINGLIKKGYSVEEVRSLLNDKNIIISSNKLKQSLKELDKSKSQLANRAKQTTIAADASPVEVETDQPLVDVPQPPPKPVPKDNSTTTATDQPYKSPPKPGADNFK